MSLLWEKVQGHINSCAQITRESSMNWAVELSILNKLNKAQR